MEQLNKLKNEIREAEEKKRVDKIVSERHETVVKGIEAVGEKIDRIKAETIKVHVENPTEAPTEIKVTNLADIVIPEVHIPETIIPEYPKEIGIKEPKWFSLKGVIKEIKDLRTVLAKAFDFNAEYFTKKQNAIAVKLVTRDGKEFYNAGGGGGSQGGFSNQDSKNLEAIRTNTGNLGTDWESLIHTNTHTGSDELRVYRENHICLQNTTTTLLGANETFTGQWQDCLNYQEVNVSIDASHNSATNGLVIQWSADATNIGDTDTFSIYANSGTNYTPNPAFRYVRVVYTNGAVQQTRFSLMTILRRSNTGGSFHRIDSTLRDDSDARLVLAVPKLKTASNTYVSQQATTAGNAKVSIEEFDASVSTDTNKLNTAVYLTDENGVISQMLGDTLYPGAPIVIDIDHHEVHCGDSYTATRTVDLTNGATDTIIINVPNNATKRYHMVVTCTTELEADYNVYEGATTVADGTAMTNYNRDRNSGNTSTLAITHTPNTPSGGTLIYTDHWGAGRASGGETRGQQEIILKNNTKYRLTITNSTSNNNYVSWKFSHYVHPDA